MSRLMNAIRLLVLAACLAPLLALASSGSSYRVALADPQNTDPASTAKQIAAQYHGHLETAVDEHGTFLMTLSSATADLLRRDPRVSRLDRQEVIASATVAPNASATWTLGDGNYQYDGSGNIKAVGSQVFVYDVENRLVSEGTIGTTATKQKYTYDGFGNILTYKDDDGFTYTVGASAATNRASVTSSSAFHMSGTYDNSGNMIARSDDTFRYDALNVMTKSFADGQWRAYVYNVSDERVGTILMTAETGGAETSSEWTIRDAAGQALRRFSKQGGQYVWQQDYIYRDGKMLASEVTGQIGTLHYHLDHLGSPRLITGNGGVQVSRHTYYPFGKEVVTGQPVREDKKFTGHERDPIGLDYMHARFYDYRMGRFISVDPGKDWELGYPQSWNMYAYVRNNPINRTDPTGRCGESADFIGPTIPCAGRGAQGALIHAGATTVNDAAVRRQYVEITSQLSPTDSAARTRAKITARAQTSTTGQAIAESMRPMAGEAARVGGTASRTNVAVNEGVAVAGRAGRVTLVAGATISVVRIATAEGGETARVVAQEGGAWAGALSFGSAGAKGGAAIGSFFAPGPGTVVGGILGGIGGGIVGGILGARAADNVYQATVD